MNAMTPKPRATTADTQGTPDRRPASFRRGTLRALAAATVVAGASTLVTWWVTEGRFIESTDNAFVQGDIALLSPRMAWTYRALH